MITGWQTSPSKLDQSDRTWSRWQTAVTASLGNKQLLLFAFTRISQIGHTSITIPRQTAVTAYLESKQLLLFVSSRTSRRRTEAAKTGPSWSVTLSANTKQQPIAGSMLLRRLRRWLTMTQQWINVYCLLSLQSSTSQSPHILLHHVNQGVKMIWGSLEKWLGVYSILGRFISRRTEHVLL